MSNYAFMAEIHEEDGSVWMNLDSLITYFETDFAGEEVALQEIAKFTAYMLRGIKEKAATSFVS